MKELILHTDLRREDTIFYITSCSWMMWNWLISSLAVGATIVLYDGNPNFPDTGAMWKLIEDEKVTVFGCSASYIHLLKKVEEKPGRFNLSSLREISQTGSPLSVDGFQYVYSEIKNDVHLNSISGRDGYQRLLRGREPDPAGLRGRTSKSGVGYENKGVRREGIPGLR